MSPDRRDALLDQDRGDAWESLPTAPALVPRRKTAQITLRLPSHTLARVRRVADKRSLPYHALARSWIVAGLRSGEPPDASDRPAQTQAEQLNVKLDQGLLDELKARAGRLRRPYHRLAREWIEAAVNREEQSLGLEPGKGAKARAILRAASRTSALAARTTHHRLEGTTPSPTPNLSAERTQTDA